MLDERMTVTDAIARRDVLRWRHALYTSVADEAAKQHRELDVRIQQANWETELMD